MFVNGKTAKLYKAWVNLLQKALLELGPAGLNSSFGDKHASLFVRGVNEE
jgi:hypothetical protein